jgi:glucose-1-phosphate thymidylyltransferase
MLSTNNDTRRRRLIGVIPAAGQGARLAPFSYPKELLPIVYTSAGGKNGPVTPRPVLQLSLDVMKAAGITECIIVIANWKLEIARVFGDGGASGISLCYVMRNVPRGLADAVDAAYPWVRGHDVGLTLPDTVLSPGDALHRLWCERQSSEADLVLGVFPTSTPEELGPVRVDLQGKVVEVLDKPKTTDLRNTWGLAVWSPRFTALLHEEVRMAPEDAKPVLGAVFQRAVERGFSVRAAYFDTGSYLDVGTPEGLGKVVPMGEAEFKPEA